MRRSAGENVSIQRLQHECPPRPVSGPSSRRGLSLLEVLIACGVLALGLAGVAAIIPAAGRRFGAAYVADRARFVAVNAHAEMLNRGLASVAACSGAARAFVFGPALAGVAGLRPSVAAATPSLFDRPRLCSSEDEVVFVRQSRPVGQNYGGPLVHSGGPGNVFTNPSGFTNPIGPRAYRDSLVWGATLVPLAVPAQAGGAAVLSVVVLSRIGTPALIQLTRNADGTYQCAEADRMQRLPACAAVFVVADASGDVQRPAWVSVRASWPGGVALDGEGIAPDWQAASLRAVGFDGFLRVEHHPVTLQ